MHVNEINIQVRFYNYYCDNLIKEKPLESKDILIDEKNYKDLVIYFTRYVHSKSIKMLSLHYSELMTKIEEHERKKYSMVDDNVLDKVLDKIKKK